MFRNKYFNVASRNLMSDFRICASILKDFHPLIIDRSDAQAILDRAMQRLNLPNYLGASGASGTKVVTRKYLFDQIQGHNLPSFSEKLDYYEDFLLIPYGDTEIAKKCLKERFSYVKTELKKRWTKASKHDEVFLKNNRYWLEGTFEIPIESRPPQGRPPKSFEDLSERSRRRKTEEVRANLGPDVIIHAAQSVLQSTGHRDASKVLKEITNSPTRASKYRTAYSKVNNDDEVSPPLTPLQALLRTYLPNLLTNIFVEADLSRRNNKGNKPKTFPLLCSFAKGKKRMLSARGIYECNGYFRREQHTMPNGPYCDTLINIPRRGTNYRCHVNEEERKSLTIICKWGCDGSQQSKFKQSFDNDTDSDGNIFLSSFVPLRIVCGKDGKIIWQNPTPSSPRFCRPIRFWSSVGSKESTDVTKEEISYVQDSVRLLNSTKVILQNKEYEFEHILKMTMVDGKVCNAATGTKSTSRCYICGATSKTFNDLNSKNEVSPEALEFGLSVLHARIRISESILHLAYKLPVKKYGERRTTEERALEGQRKSETLWSALDMIAPSTPSTSRGQETPPPMLSHDLRNVDMAPSLAQNRGRRLSNIRRPLRDDELSALINYGSEEESDEEEEVTQSVAVPRVARMFMDEEDENVEEGCVNITLEWSPQPPRPITSQHPLCRRPPRRRVPRRCLIPKLPWSRATNLNLNGERFQIELLLRREPFSQNIGPTVSFTNPYEAFTAIWDREIIELIVRETNIYAQQLTTTMLEDGAMCPNSRITRYLRRFEVHAGHETSAVQEGHDPVSEIVPALVLKLLNGLEHKGHTIWMDNFYNSPALARELKVRGFDCVGTLRTNRQFVPSQLASITKKKRVGQMIGCTSGDVDLMVWRDKNRVAFVSTYHGVATSRCRDTLKPTVVQDYNICIGGVDRKDQQIAIYPIERRRTKVRYKKKF
ncbi:hypothetical protein HF086_007669 [Spodoptera exigua]|uniref:PiggyBac transposable element-derived protein domain-containing protein n=1 Tax=Spodoptera exigua TaxID=7107 RepID=A0A922M6M4_SPOEX|nr:hypothetical protein HF086_007669 [Spodoptera exigua]